MDTARSVVNRATRTRGWHRALTRAATALILVVVSNAASAADPLDVGVAVALTGPLATSDLYYAGGVKLAADTINLAGGVGGRQLRIHVRDNASNAATGVTVTNQLTNEFNLVAMISGASSAHTAAIHPIQIRQKVPALTISVLPPSPTWTFMTNVEFTRFLDIQLRFVKEELKGKKVALLHSNTPFGQIGAKILLGMASSLDMEVLHVEGVENTATDLTPQMAKIKQLSPDAILDLTNGSIHVVEAQAAATVGLQVPIIMSMDDFNTFRIAAAAYPKVHFISTPVQTFPAVSPPQYKDACAAFLEAYQKAGLDPLGVMGASSGWDAVHMLARALAQSKSMSGQDVRDSIEKLSYQGCTTLYEFSPDDHTGQKGRRNPLSISRYEGKSPKVVFGQN